MTRDSIKRVLQQHIDEGTLELGLLQLLQSIAHGRELTADEEQIRTFIIEFHAVLGRAANGALALDQVPADCDNQALRLTAKEFAAAGKAELAGLYMALGRLLYGDSWQPTAKEA